MPKQIYLLIFLVLVSKVSFSSNDENVNYPKVAPINFAFEKHNRLSSTVSINSGYLFLTECETHGLFVETKFGDKGSVFQVGYKGDCLHGGGSANLSYMQLKNDNEYLGPTFQLRFLNTRAEVGLYAPINDSTSDSSWMISFSLAIVSLRY